jgi:hypothetical protein
MNHRADQPEEFASVLMAGEPEREKGKGLLRPWLFCLIFLLIIEILLRLFFHPVDNYLLSESLYDTPEITSLHTFLKQIGRSKNLKVVMLGDSIVGGGACPKDQTMARHLERILREAFPGQPIEVWNLGMGGSRAADIYFLLKRVIPLKPDLVILNSNYRLFSRIYLEKRPIARPWLVSHLEEEPAELIARIPGLKEEVIDPREERVSEIIARYSALYAHRYDLKFFFNQRLFGAPLTKIIEKWEKKIRFWITRIMGGNVRTRDNVEEVLFLPWDKKPIPDLKELRQYYELTPFSSDNINLIFSEKISELLDRSHTPAFVFSSPENHTLAGPIINNPQYEANLSRIDQIFSGNSFVYRNYDKKIEDRYFADKDHLTGEGNRVFAGILAQGTIPLLGRKGFKGSRNRDDL